MKLISRKLGTKNGPVKEHKVCSAFDDSYTELTLRAHNHHGTEFYIHLGFDGRTYRLALNRQEALDLRRSLEHALAGTSGNAL